MTYYISEKGFAGLYMMVLVLVFSVSIIGSIGFGVVVQQRTVQNVVRSAQAQYVAESGVEDALLRLEKQWNAPSSYSVGVGGYSSAVTISNIVGGARTITVQGDATNRIRSAEVVYQLSSSVPGFAYGVHVGAGGLTMSNESTVNGNVYSNGTITGTNESEINGDATAVGTISSPDPDISGTTTTGAPAIPLPISDATIQGWKNDAAAGTVISGDYSRTSGTNSLGPANITGNLTISNEATLNVTGTIWVEGTITIKNEALVQLDSGYGTAGGVVVGDGEISLDNESVSRGSGQAGSYLMYISTSSSSEAIEIKNEAEADVLYTNNGTIVIDNEALMKEVVGYGLEIKNEAEVTFESGLQSATFTSGSGGGWSVESWKEVE